MTSIFGAAKNMRSTMVILIRYIEVCSFFRVPERKMALDMYVQSKPIYAHRHPMRWYGRH